MPLKSWNKAKISKGNTVNVNLSLCCTSSLTSWCFFSPSHSFKLRHSSYYIVVKSTLELSFLHTTMVYITALCTASRQFTAVRHYLPPLDVPFSCSGNQPVQLRSAGRTGCQLTFGASWWLLQSAKGLIFHCKVPATPPIVRVLQFPCKPPVLK